MDFLETIHAGGKPLFVNGLNIRSKVSPSNFDVPSRNCSLSQSLTHSPSSYRSNRGYFWCNCVIFANLTAMQCELVVTRCRHECCEPWFSAVGLVNRSPRHAVEHHSASWRRIRPR